MNLGVIPQQGPCDSLCRPKFSVRAAEASAGIGILMQKLIRLFSSLWPMWRSETAASFCFYYQGSSAHRRVSDA